MAKTTVNKGDTLLNKTNNQTTYADAPITGGETKIVINELQIRQSLRKNFGIGDWRTALIGADGRYFPNRTQLYDIYEDMLLDGHLSGIISKRIDTVLNKPLYYKDKEGNTIEDFNPFIRTLTFRNICRHILETQFWGITGLEFIPGHEVQVRLIPRKHIKTKTQLISFEQTNQDSGIDYTKLDNVWVIGEPEDLGLLLKCSYYVIYKRALLGDWSQYIERFGMPIQIMYYDANDTQAKIELRQILQNAGSAMQLMIPKGVDFKIEDVKTINGTGDLQDTFMRALNSELSIIVLGNTETTSSGSSSGGSMAKSKVHSQQQDEIAKSDIMYLSSMLNSPHFHNILKSYGLPLIQDGFFEVTKEIDANALFLQAQRDQILSQVGVKMTHEYFYETYNLPEPENDSDLVCPPPGTLSPTNGQTDKPQTKPASKPPIKKPVPDLSDDIVNTIYNKLEARISSFFDQAGS